MEALQNGIELGLREEPAQEAKWRRSQPEFRVDPGGEAGWSKLEFWAGLTHRSADFASLQKNSQGQICARSLGSACCRSPRSVRTGSGRAGKVPGVSTGPVKGQVIPGGSSGLGEDSPTHLPPLLAGPALRVKHHHCGREQGQGRERRQVRPHPLPAPQSHPRTKFPRTPPWCRLLGSDLEKVSRSSRFLEKATDRWTEGGSS